jgi:hypothetical protein
MILKPKTQKTQETQTSSHNSEHTYLDEDSALSDAADFEQQELQDQAQLRASQEALRQQEELNRIVEANMKQYKDAMASTFREIMYGTSEKKEGAD